MLKRASAAIRRLLHTEQDESTFHSKRSFFKRAAVSAISVTTTAGLAKAVVDSTPEPNMRNHYTKDSHAGEDKLREREYVLMSDQEKADTVQTLIDHHLDQS